MNAREEKCNTPSVSWDRALDSPHVGWTHSDHYSPPWHVALLRGLDSWYGSSNDHKTASHDTKTRETCLKCLVPDIVNAGQCQALNCRGVPTVYSVLHFFISQPSVVRTVSPEEEENEPEGCFSHADDTVRGCPIFYILVLGQTGIKLSKKINDQNLLQNVNEYSNIR